MERNSSKPHKKTNMRGKQGRKDNKSKRINLDNERVSKFEKDMRDSSGYKDCRSNDVLWYARTPELLRSAASLPFSTTVGQKPEINLVNAVPGVMALVWYPTVGGQSGEPINQAANSTYSFTVHANSRNYQYDPSDQMKMIIAGMNVFCAIAAGLRVYGIMRKFDQRDSYTPEALVQAMGFSYTDWRQNLAQAWFGLNELISRVSQIWIPNTMPVLDRWFWMNSNVYRDGATAKSQYYVFRQGGYYKYVVGSSAENTNLVMTEFNTGMTFQQYIQFVNDLIDPLLQSQDRGIIFGDILKAYGADKIFAMNAITSDYMVNPVYDMEVLTQIENATVHKNKPVSISEDTVSGRLVESWATDTYQTIQPSPDKQVLNFHQDAVPTPEQIMVATRLKSAGAYVTAYTGGGTPVYALSPAAYGTEVINAVISLYYQWNSATKTIAALVINENSQTTTDFGDNTMYQWVSYDWAPWLYKVSSVTPPTAANSELIVTARMAIGDYDQYTYIDKESLKKMHTTALYSEFGVPTI